MNQEGSIIGLYLRIEDGYKKIMQSCRLRERGEKPSLSDVEVLTIEIFGE
jgi:hypothetical protein